MKESLHILKICPLFAGIDSSEVMTILDCLSATRKEYEKNGFVFRAEEPASSVGIVLSGSIHIVQDDFWGNRRILARIAPGGLFGEAFSCGEMNVLPFTVMAVEKSRILFVDYKKIISLCSSVCVFHSRLIRNIIRILAEENIMLIQKIEHITRHTTREKLLSYLSSQAQQLGVRHFEIPFNRQELADYLAVDRSAMSHELCKMRDEGLIRFKRNHFELCTPLE